MLSSFQQCSHSFQVLKKPDTVVYGQHSLVNFKFQAKRTDGTDEAGIIPSQICEER